MNQLIEKFPAQLREALTIGQKAAISIPENEIRQVFMAGMGGSGIGGNFVAEFIRNECKVPYLIGKSYEIPKFIDQHTLAIVSSYSGNTEETLNAFMQLLEIGCKIVVIASGGKLIQHAKEKKLDFIELPSGWPSPRACLGYSLVQQLSILFKLNMISSNALEKILKGADLLDHESFGIKAKAKRIANALAGKIPVIYSSDRMEPAGLRLRQQICENAKMLCWHHVFPEMNHNELVGWAHTYENLGVFIMRSSYDHQRTGIRMDITKEIIQKYAPDVIEVQAKGESLIEESLYLVHLGDWISWYLSELNNVDAVEIRVIDLLKSELAKYN